LKTEELIACLGCFLEADDIEQSPSTGELCVPDAVKDAVRKINKIAGQLQAHETDVRSNPEFWVVHTYWIEILYRWMNGEDITVLCQDYGVYEGNFTKAILKVANVAEEWMNVATLKQDLETLERLRDIRPKLVRGIVVPDSIYLRL
jgi:superfamily II RNA helicase